MPRKLLKPGLRWVQRGSISPLVGSWPPRMGSPGPSILPRLLPPASSLGDPLTLQAPLAAGLASAGPPRSRALDGGPGLRSPAARPRSGPASLSLYPWDKCLIPQGVKGKINHPGEISQPADLAGERQREIGGSHGLVGSPIKGWKMLALRLQMGNITVPVSPVPVTSGNRC